MTEAKRAACPRPYTLGERQKESDRKRSTVLATARAALESNGFADFSLESIARQSAVTRQTVYNLFGSKTGLLEALFDAIAVDGGMQRMRLVMQHADAESALASFVDVFCDFWAKDRLLIRRIHGIAAIDPEIGSVVEARNRRRQGAAIRILQMMDDEGTKRTPEEQSQRAAALYALTSFEFFDVLADSCGSTEQATRLVRVLTEKSLLVSSPEI